MYVKMIRRIEIAHLIKKICCKFYENLKYCTKAKKHILFNP